MFLVFHHICDLRLPPSTAAVSFNRYKCSEREREREGTLLKSPSPSSRTAQSSFLPAGLPMDRPVPPPRRRRPGPGHNADSLMPPPAPVGVSASNRSASTRSAASTASSASSAAGPVRSVEGWVIFVTGLQQEEGGEVQEEDLHDLFGEYGRIKSLHLNRDRRTGSVKGYALLEYAEREEAQDAINALHGRTVLGGRINVHWAFCRGSTGPAGAPSSSSSRRGGRRGGTAGHGHR